jgi:hypothetical protein
MTELMVVAIDWPGRLDDKGRATWMAVIRDGVFCVLENGRSRPEVRDELIRLRRMSGRLVVGIDFAFGFPQWYAEANDWRCGRDIWRAAHEMASCGLRRALRRSGDAPLNVPRIRVLHCAGPSRRLAGHRDRSSRSAGQVPLAPDRSAGWLCSMSLPAPGSPYGRSSRRITRPSSRSTLAFSRGRW